MSESIRHGAMLLLDGSIQAIARPDEVPNSCVAIILHIAKALP